MAGEDDRDGNDHTGAGASRAADTLLVAAGGAVGSVVRHMLSGAIPSAGGFPFGVFAVNVSGAALLGFLMASLGRRGPDVGRRRTARLVLGPGVLGGYTTYSALATHSGDLVLDGRSGLAATYALATVVAGAVAAWVGVVAARGPGRPR